MRQTFWINDKQAAIGNAFILFQNAVCFRKGMGRIRNDWNVHFAETAFSAKKGLNYGIVGPQVHLSFVMYG